MFGGTPVGHVMDQKFKPSFLLFSKIVYIAMVKWFPLKISKKGKTKMQYVEKLLETNEKNNEIGWTIAWN